MMIQNLRKVNFLVSLSEMEMDSSPQREKLREKRVLKSDQLQELKA